MVWCGMVFSMAWYNVGCLETALNPWLSCPVLFCFVLCGVVWHGVVRYGTCTCMVQTAVSWYSVVRHVLLCYGSFFSIVCYGMGWDGCLELALDPHIGCYCMVSHGSFLVQYAITWMSCYVMAHCCMLQHDMVHT